MVFGISLLSVILLANFSFAIRINEVESNPEGSDAKNEWVELYSESEIDLNGWQIVNSDQQSKELEGVFQGYFIINFSTQWLDNSEESLSLYHGSVLMDSVTSLQDSYNDNRTWQYCDGDWSFLDSSKNQKNDCEEEENNNSQENNNQENNNTTEPKKGKISVELENTEEDIQNGEDFEIDALASNLEDKEYDIRLYVYDKDGNIISEIYDDKEDKWKSGTYFVTEFFQGPGNQTETAKLRIRENYADFKGEASIRIRIRATGTSPIIAERAYPIDILEKKEDSTTEEESTTDEQESKENNEDNRIEQESSEIAGNIIKLGNREAAKEKANETIEEGKILYESSNEKIKKYSMYGLNLVLVVIIVFLLISFKKKQNQD